MRKFSFLGVSSAVVAAVLVQPAMAQDATTGAAAAPANDDIIIVSGIAQTIQASEELKRRADAVSEFIVLEDIGSYLDESIADSLERVPGVQIDRDLEGTGGDRVSIRGLGPQFVSTTVNGRRFLSSGDGSGKAVRQGNLDIFAPGILSGVKVAKSSTALTNDAGVGGGVDLQTARPLEMRLLRRDQSFLRMNGRYSYNDLADDDGYRASAFGGWRNDDSTFGIMGAVVFDEGTTTRDRTTLTSYRDGVVFNIAGGTTLPALVPVAVQSDVLFTDTKRLAGSATMQFAPTDDLMITLDGTYTKLERATNLSRGNLTGLPPAIFTEYTFPASAVQVNEDGIATLIDFSQGTRAGNRLAQGRISSTDFISNNTTYLVGANVKWTTGILTTNFDAYYNNLNSRDERIAGQVATNINPNDIALVLTDKFIGVTGPGGTSDFSLSSNPLDYSYLTAVRVNGGSKADSIGGSMIFDFDQSLGPIADWNAGIRYEDTNISGRSSQNNQISLAALRGITGLTNAQIHTLAQTAISGSAVGDRTFLPGIGFIGMSDWPELNLTTLVDAFPGFSDALTAAAVNDPRQSYSTQEKIYTTFLQGNIDTFALGMEVTGNIGVRWTRTETKSLGAVVDDISGAVTPLFVRKSYEDVLPSVNLNFGVADNMALRLAFTETLSRPEYIETAPIFRLGSEVDDDEDDDGLLRSLIASNPDLEPIRSRNFDITGEYYGRYGTTVILSGFYKEVQDFIVQFPIGAVQIDLLGDEFFRARQFVNFTDAKVWGFELGVSQQLGKLVDALDGFGFSTNYTYTDSKTDTVLSDNLSGNAVSKLPGISRNNLNLVGYYEEDLFSVRVAYTYRSKFFRGFAAVGGAAFRTGLEAALVDAQFGNTRENLAANFTLKPTKNLTFTLSGSNLTNNASTSTLGLPTAFDNTTVVGRSFRADVRISF